MGSMSKSSIQSVIRKNISKVNRVYERALQKDPTLRGKIVVSFVVGPKGTVTSAKITYSTIKSLKMQAEILKVIKRMKFPKPAGGGSIQVSYPFIFHSAG
jgi:TonB family protein